MDWTVVEDSNIAEVGFEAPSTLGLKFKPWNPEKPVTTYTYANVTPDLHTELLAAKDNPEYGSIRKFFDAKIKKHPELYPFTKVA